MMRSVIAIAALLACLGANASSLGLELLLTGVEGVIDAHKKEQLLIRVLAVQHWKIECETLKESDPNACPEPYQGDQWDLSIEFGEAMLDQYKECHKAAGELPTREEKKNARGQCKQELDSNTLR